MLDTRNLLLQLCLCLLVGVKAACGANLMVVHTTTALIAASTTTPSVMKDGYFSQGDMPAQVYMGSSSACTLKSGAGDGGYQIAASDGGCWIAAPLDGGWPVQMWGTHGDGATDDTVAIQNALNACFTIGGGKVLIGAQMYLVDSANIIIPGGCVLSAAFWPGFRQGNNIYSFVYTIVLNPAYTLTSASGNGTNKGIENIFLINKNQYRAGPPANYRAAITDIANYSGTAITIDGGVDFIISNVNILGFADCVNIIYNGRPVLDHVYGDCTNGIVASSIYDPGKWRDLEMFPELLAFGPANFPNSHADVSIAITGVTSDAGQYCLTVGTSSFITPATGDTVYVKSIGGAVGANGVFGISVNATGCNPGVLLTGSVVAPNPTATVAAGNQWIQLNSAPAKWVYWVGQLVNDAASANVIPSGAVVDQVWIGENLVHINKVPTGTSSVDTLSVSNPAYTSGGTLTYTLNRRTGVGYDITNSKSVDCWECYVYGYQTGVHIGSGAGFVDFSGGGSDNDGGLNDPTTIAILIDGTASGPEFVGFDVESAGRAVVANNAGSTAQAPNTFIGGQYFSAGIPGYYAGPSFELNSAWYNEISGVPLTGNMQISNNNKGVLFGQITGPAGLPVFNNANALALTQQDGASIFNPGFPLVGSPSFSNLRAGSLSSTGTFRQTATTVGKLSGIDPLPSVGDRAVVTDATTCTFGSSIAGGGTTVCPIVYNGSGWIAG